MKFYRNIRTLYTPLGFRAAKGRDAMRLVQVIEQAAILCDDQGVILLAGHEEAVRRSVTGEHEVIDCRGLVALPGFVDSHTHAVFAGDRSLEFGMRAAGKSYQEVAAAGGGIKSSVSQVRENTLETIVEHSKRYILSALSLGTTTMEVKSGYGLHTASEIKLLQAARQLSKITPMEIHTTFLGAHAVPHGTSQSDYVREVIEKQLPAIVAERGLAEFIDVFCDEGYFTNEETRAIIEAGIKTGLKPRLHVDELADTGGAELAVSLGCYSADHLLRVNARGIGALASSNRTVATLLPTTALSLRVDYAPGRKLIDAGAAVAIATDCNPGSSMTENMQFVMTLAVIGMQLSVEEALTAATLNGAAALGLEKTHGTIEPGKQLDVVFYDIPSLAYLPYHIAVSDVVTTVKRGEIVLGEVFDSRFERLRDTL